MCSFIKTVKKFIPLFRVSDDQCEGESFRGNLASFVCQMRIAVSLSGKVASGTSSFIRSQEGHIAGVEAGHIVWDGMDKYKEYIDCG